MIQKIWINQFRNLQETVLECQSDTSVYIYGDNNQGKTNFLEALYVLGNGVSPNEKNLKHLIQFNQPHTVLGLDKRVNNQTYRVYIKISNEGKRYIVLNNKQIKRLRTLYSQFHIDYLSSDIIKIFQNSPDFRRKDLDHFIGKAESDYIAVTRNYHKVLRHKNHLLKNGGTVEQILNWNEQLLKYAMIINEKRGIFLKILEDGLTQLLQGISSFLSATAKINYILSSTSLAAMLQDNIHKEIQAKQCLYGPHRDDFEIFINQKSVPVFYSRGINRIVSILYKLYQIIYLDKLKNSFPTLLMDEPFAEVDDKMKAQLIRIIEPLTQIFYVTIDSTDMQWFTKKLKVFHMNNGELTDGNCG